MDASQPESVHIREVGPRESFQNVDETVPTDEKIEIIERLIEAGCTELNVASFVHPKITPQVGDAEDVLHGLPQREDLTYMGLIPNEKGLERAIDVRKEGAQLDKLLFLYSMTEAVLRANGVERTVEEQFEQVDGFLDRAAEHGFETLVGISSSFGCSLSGPVPREDVVAEAERLRDAGADEVFFSDSTGQASPMQVRQLFQRVDEELPELPVTLHLHDSRGAGLANVIPALEVGKKNLTVSSAFGGLGGDPPLEQSKGNISTEDLVCMLGGMGIDTGIDLDEYLEASRYAQEQFETPFVAKTLDIGPSIAYKENAPQEGN